MTPPIPTGIFGGSFNPIHRAHIDLAETIVGQGWVKELWLMVTPHNPLKHSQDLWPDDLRLELARIATQRHAHIHVCDLEYHLPRPSYTFQTLTTLTRLHPDRRFHLVIGGDNWACFDRWKHWEEIIQRYPLIIYPRPDAPIDPATLPPGARLIDAPLHPISSTAIREALRRGEPVSQWLDCEVEQRIRAFLHEKHTGTIV